MKSLKIMSLSAFIMVLSSLLSCSEDNSFPAHEQMKIDLENLSGTYMDLTPYAYGEAFGQRIFTFDKGTWTLNFTLGLDPNLENKVFEFRTVGTYSVLNPSSVLDNAYNALFLEDKKFLTLKTDDPALIQAFGFSDCGLTPNEEKDISATGCSAWAAVTECNEDHDLLSLDDEGLLYFGVRPPDNNMCTEDKRPTSLTPGVTRI